MDTQGDPKTWSIDEQLAWLLEGTYFADEGGLADGEEAEGGIRAQMAAELKRKLDEDNAFVQRILQQPKIVLMGDMDDIEELAESREDKSAQG